MPLQTDGGRLVPTARAEVPEVVDRSFTFDDWLTSGLVSFGGLNYGSTSNWGSTASTERAPSFMNYAGLGYKSNGPVFSLITTRALILSQAEFQFRDRHGNRSGELYGTPALRLLEQPEPGKTTAELLATMEVDASLAGNAYVVRRGDRLKRLRPDKVSIVIGVAGNPEADPTSVDSEVLGYVYHRGPAETDFDLFTVGEVAHFSPIPDPLASYRGMSWLTPIVREVSADEAVTTHVEGFFRNGANLGYVIKLNSDMFKFGGPGGDGRVVQQIKDQFQRLHAGAARHNQALVLGAGMDVTTVGSTFRDAELKSLRAAGETRLAAAAGVPPVIAGFSDGIEAATYSNYSQARRRFADGTLRPLWRGMADALSVLVDMPTENTKLVVDTSQVAFLREDEGDQSEILVRQAGAIRQLIDAGYDPDAAVRTVTAGDLRGLVGQHSGLPSVQLQKSPAVA